METRTAIVTGASQGLGLAVTAELSRRGWRVVVDGRYADALHQAVEPFGDQVVAVPGDVTDPEHRDHLVAVAGPQLALVVNNAGGLGTSPLPPLADYPIDGLAELVQVNVLAPLALIQAALPPLRSNRGIVVNVTSDASVEAYEGWGGYGATKAALDHLGAVLAVEEPGVRVLTIDPGDMRTRMHQDAFPGEDISDRPLPEERAPGIVAMVEGDEPSGRYRVSSPSPTDEVVPT